MSTTTLINKVNQQLNRVAKLEAKKSTIEATLRVANDQMSKILQEQDLLDKTTVAIQQARPLLSASSIKQCEALANQAIQTIFELPYTVEWNVENSRFYLNKENYQVDLVDAEGGGMNSVIGFIFELYLLVKSGKRKLMVYDEAWTAISDEYIGRFIEFVHQLSKDLDFTIVAVTHDNRITLDMVDHCYLIENGHAKKLK